MSMENPQNEKRDGQHYTQLPNGLFICHQNQYETEFVYEEIFREKVYLKQGIAIHNGDCIVDIGANIGLFSLFALQQGSDIRVYAVEPAPELAEMIRLNTREYQAQVKILRCGVSDRKGTGRFTFYPGYSIISGFNADLERDCATLKACLPGSGPDGDEFEERCRDAMIKQKLGMVREYDCPLQTLSGIIAEYGIAVIDLLKIDAERCELDIVRGIADRDWPKIRQIVMELHDGDGRLREELVPRLQEKGFTVNLEAEKQLAHSGILNIYAVRGGYEAKPGGAGLQPGAKDDFPTTASKVSVAVAASFTVEPLREGLDFWAGELGIPFDFRPAPYNQIFQELLNPAGVLASNADGLNAVLLKFDDWLRFRNPGAGHPGAPGTGLRKHLRAVCDDFIRALQGYTGKTRCFTMLLLCPVSPVYAENLSYQALFAELETKLRQELEGWDGIALVKTGEYHRQYEIERIFDPLSDTMGHIPYAVEYYHFLATLIVRRWYSLRNSPYKAIILDCDNTLWEGVCGETGAAGVKVAGIYADFQRWLVQKSGEGVLLCLCSKNNDNDVWEVFERQEAMILSREQITASRINWRPKPENIRSLAAALQLGTDSFIVIDDNPLECAAVRAECPEVLTLQWPPAKDNASFLDHLWVLDKNTVTVEDRNRQQSYRANAEREKLKESCYGFDDFLKKLELRIRIESVTEAQLERVAQLSQRTNQFNFTTVRLSRAELANLLREPSCECRTVEVSDRFGAYGIVGAALTKASGKILEIFALFLSCRVLGRGVEYELLRNLGELAKAKRLKWLKAVYRRTAKNEPARLFLEAAASNYRRAVSPQETVYLIPRKALAKLNFRRSAALREGSSTAKNGEFPDAGCAGLFRDVRLKEDLTIRIATGLGNVKSLSRAIEWSRMRQGASPGRAAEVGNRAGGPDPLPGRERDLREDDSLLGRIKAAFSHALAIAPEELDEDAGIDAYLERNSLKSVEVTSRLNREFGNISPTLLFERRTIRSIAEAIAPNSKLSTGNALRGAPAGSDADIAIIGMQGRFPQAANTREYWHNLTGGICSITEIPDDRWNVAEFYSEDGGAAKSYCKWGGFLEGIDRFEAAFFTIAPREAELMDPQQRLFMELVWGLLEDAGYTPETLARDTGVFAGVIAGDYGTLTNQAALLGESAYRDTDFYQIPNRISYFYDFHGPSLAVDTACSSAGTALHLACGSIRAGECSVAIVGGINLFLHPGRFIQYAQMQVLSHERRCRPFGAGATGTIYGEGAGAVLLKPLSAAKRDGDHIYAVIKGSAVNASGKTTGFTVPNPIAQQQLISRVFAASGIDARTVSYVEAHGTGTPLGDPIEIRGLTEGYRSSSKMAGYENDTQYCAIGSVKSNIGHLESGAAMAGLIKILLQMKYGILVPSLHAEESNPLIPFERTPFYLQRKAEEWVRPRLTMAGRTVVAPRRAGLSSFGAGGVNTHFLLEEYREESPERTAEEPLLFLFSAGNETQLKQRVRDFWEVLPDLRTASGGARLSDIAYTLQVGRQGMRHRVAVIAADWEELQEKLERYCEEGPDSFGFYRGTVKNAAVEPPIWPGDAAEHDGSNRNGLEKLAVLWADGTAIDWSRLYSGGAPRRVPLPTYRFNGERYWIARTGSQTSCFTAVPPNYGLRPLSDGEHFGFDGPSFKKILSGKDPLLRDHVVNGRMVLPGVAYLELARVAARLAAQGGRVRRIKQLVWVRPVILQGAEQDFQITLLPKADLIHGTAWTVDPAGRPVTHAEWEMEPEAAVEAEKNPERTDIPALLGQCAGRIGKSESYELLTKVGYQYGKSFQVMESLHYRADLAVSRLELQEKSDAAMALPPALLDGALQTVTVWISKARQTPAVPYVPFTIAAVEICRPLPPVCYAVVSDASATAIAHPDLPKYNLRLLNDAGELLVRIDEYFPRPFGPEKATVKEVSSAAELFFRSSWEEEELSGETPGTAAPLSYLVFGRERPDFRRSDPGLDQSTPELVLVKPGERYRDCGGRVYEINPGSEADYVDLVQALEAGGLMPARIVYLWSRGEEGSGFAEWQLHLERGFHTIRLLCKALSAGARAEPVNILYAFGNERGDAQPQFAALGGMMRSIYRENPRFSFKMVELRGTGFSTGELEALVGRELQNRWRGVAEIKYESGKRFRKRIRPVDPAAEPPVSTREWLRAPAGLRPRGVYLITGGLGRLGLIFARYLAGRVQARLVLAGRSDPGGAGTAKLKQLQQEHPEAEISYVKADIAKRREVRALVAAVQSRYGRLDGIIHSAGTIRDALLIHKTRADAETVIAPKVWGSVWLDEATSREKLDFFVMFSSTAAVAGHIGQSDYAYANRFLDEFAPLREALRRKGLRHGKTLAINWPWWREGGMGLGEHALKHLEQLYGLRGLDTKRGLEIFEMALQSRGPNMGLLIGDPEKLDGWLETGETTGWGQTEPVESAWSGTTAGSFRQTLETDLIRDAADILKLPVEKVDPEAKLSDFGFDSITFTGFANRINGRYQTSVSPAHFYEYRTLAAFAAFLRRDHRSRLEEYYAPQPTAGPSGRDGAAPGEVTAAGTRPRLAEGDDHHRDTGGGTDVAVIGVAGKFPQSENTEEFWTHLVSERDLISEIPVERWDWREYYGRPGSGPDRTDIKWGGFMNDVDRFDASFFGISPREAAYMDPQQRLFLETVWRAIEDAGYGPAALSGSATGLFVGASINDYNELINDSGLAVDPFVSSGVNNSIIANRVSYLLNLRGPSEVIDTACSSSLVALKRAVESIRGGECPLAVAGGVNLILRPKFHISFRMTGMLSGDGRCKTFDRDADGYVRGEGVGAVLLKPLQRAVADGDQIYAVIKAVVENHGGGAQSLTAPNPEAQAELLVAAYRKAGIPIDTVSYIEAHGTGTALGDPIEVQGLKTAFAELSAAVAPEPGTRGYCGLGSVKTNIGHLEAASGIAAVIKVLLSFKHRTLPASLHFKALNPYIELENSPFYIVDRTRPWESLRDERGGVIPRRAGVSSFGFGGTNAHMVFEEYSRPPARRQPDVGPQLIVLSARDRERLREYARKLRDDLESHGEREEASLLNIAGTLQMGRDAMSERLALIAGDVSELTQLLTGYIEGETVPDRLFTGRSAPGGAMTPADNPDGINGADLAILARSWVNGARIDWTRLGGERSWRRISLPTYPFARERHWLPQPGGAVPAAAVSRRVPAGSGIHPLLDANQSTLNGIRFVKRFGGEEFYLTDHLMGGQKVLPGVAYLEMARAAGTIAGEKITRIRKIAWVRPLAVGAEPVGVELTLNPAAEGLRYEISSVDGRGGRISHAQGLLIGEAENRPPPEPEYLDRAAIEARAVHTLSGSEIYERFEIDGSAYKHGMQAIRELRCGPREALALLRLPVGLEAGFSRYTLHPALMDGALQTVAALLTREEIRDGGPFLPFSIAEMTIMHPLTAGCYAYAVLAEREYLSDPGLRHYRIRICDASGKVLVKIEDYCVRPLRRGSVSPSPGSPAPPALETLCWREEWVKLPAVAAWTNSGGSVPDTIWLWGGNAELDRALKICLKRLDWDNTRVIRILSGTGYAHPDRDTFQIHPARRENWARLVEELTRNGAFPDWIIFDWMRAAEEGNRESGPDAMTAVIVNAAFHLNQELLKGQPAQAIRQLHLYPEVIGRSAPDSTVNLVAPALCGALSGFARTAALEYPNFRMTTLAIRSGNGGTNDPQPDELVELVLGELDSGCETEVRYENGCRYGKRLKEINLDGEDRRNDESTGLKQGGVYLITGGAGGLGRILARHLAEAYRAKLILTGRAPLSGERQSLLRELENAGAEVLYVEADSAAPEEVRRLARLSRERFTRVDGIFHCAGAIRDALLPNQTAAALMEVLAPKITGSVYLERCFRELRPDFLMFFSSLTAVAGNTGQSGYAFGNRFMDRYAELYNETRSEPEPFRMIAVNWPYWEEGGMRLNRENQRFLAVEFGMAPLDTASGLRLLTQIIAGRHNAITVVKGEGPKIRRWMKSLSRQTGPSRPDPERREDAGFDLAQAAVRFATDIRDCLAGLLQVEPVKLQPEDDLNSRGLNSLIFVDLANRINQHYSLDLTPSFFFQYATAASLAAAIFQANQARIVRVYAASRPDPLPGSNFSESAATAVSQQPNTGEDWKEAETQPSHPPGKRAGNEPVAIIGMQGIMPGSDSLAEFWENLQNGVEMVGPISPERWERMGCHGSESDPREWGGRGGFLRDIEQFDAGFFTISQKEAELMDPQQRLFLETVWQTVEDAGYRPADLSGTDTGVFVGVANSDYYDVIRDSGSKMDAYVITGKEHSILANRVSCLFNLHGPSEPVNTACSSSLVAIHRAVAALRGGQCGMAIAGGVNILSSRAYYGAAADAGMLARDGRCKTFDRRADGYVRGEGCGALLLKRLSDAERDRDHIYGLVKGTAVNHCGRTSSLTAPSSGAQADLLVAAYRDAQIDPGTVSYIETHGTGTELGDPIEIEGLQQAFRKLYRRAGKPWPSQTRIGLGSVKSAIGHLEAAAGIAGVFKVLLALKNKRIPGNLHLEEVNPYIRLEGSPFYLVKETVAWETPPDGAGGELPRRAGVSSFGLGGSNAHIILEEYRERPGGDPVTAERPQLIVLSAKNGDRLREYAEALRKFAAKALSASPGPDHLALGDIAYTLQTGREAFNARMACVVATLKELSGKLQRFCGGIRETPGLYSNEAGAGESPVEASVDTAALLRNRELDRLAMLWVSGQAIDWQALHGDGRSRRISLPTYPFAPDRYWAGGGDNRAKDRLDPAGEPQPELHFYRAEWIEQPPGAVWGGESQDPGASILIFERDNRTGATLRELLAPNASAIVSIRPGAEFAHPEPALYIINPGRSGDYRRLFAALAEAELTPGRILHIWARESYQGDPKTFRMQMELGIFSVFQITRALMTAGLTERVRFVFGYLVKPEATNPPFDAVSGFMRNAGLETNKIGFTAVAIRTAPETAGRDGGEWPAGLLLQELELDDEACEARYEGPVRLVKRFRTYDPGTADPQAAAIAGLGLVAGGVYLITGGAGGVGMICAASLARQTKVKLVLCGRSPLDDGIERKLESLRTLGAEAIYLQADIAADDQSQRLLGEIKSRFGRISGIIHSAGTLRDGLIPQKSAAAFHEVLGPKVYGAVNLDQATQEEELDFFVLFSSIAASHGNAGQCDYAYANAFLDSFASWRETLRKRGQRRGKTVAIGWPYWRDGGMRVAAEEIELYTRRTGLLPLPAAVGIKTLEICLQSDQPHLLATYGKRAEIDHFLGVVALADRGGIVVSPPALFTDRLIAKMCGYLSIIFEELLGLSAGVMEADAPLLEYGIDSILIRKFNQRIADWFEALPKTLLFEFRNLHELAEYFVAHHRRRVLEIPPEAAGMATEDPDASGWRSGRPPGVSGESPPQPESNQSGSPPNATGTDIAIIGISGRYPQAENPEEFWANLRSGRDCITGIPESRWDNRLYFDPDPNRAQEGKIYCDRGGFIANADRFDAAFFHISPREAATLDPQERLFLQTAWEVMEDAGYAGLVFDDASRKNRYREVGVFVGVTNHSYQNVEMEHWRRNPAFIPATHPWFIANRVSYFFGFSGPSLPVDTACSSSLAAVYLACESIKRGECAMALAGGVNLHFHPCQYLQMCAVKILSPQGQCRSFGAGADGFVPGEGVGAVLLKPLAQAVRDRDQIYAVVKGGAMNHGGRTNGFTVPNPQAQADVITAALQKAGIDPATISYIEAHGTGTELGDPIEIDGLTRAFRRYTMGRQFCAVGSVKSNIGHLEAAAGIAGITKVILQMKHREIPPSLHAAELNPNIDFESSPFFIQRELASWPPQPRVQDGPAELRPRRAGISSFGAGGVNVHLVLEEFGGSPGQTETGKRSERTQLIVLSAVNEERLRVCAARLAACLEKTAPVGREALASGMEALNRLNVTIRALVGKLAGTDENEIDYETALDEYGLDPVTLTTLARELREQYGLTVTGADIGPQSTVRSLSRYFWDNFPDEVDRFAPAAFRTGYLEDRLADIAFTLQTGRAALEERLALVVSGTAELVERLTEYSRGDRPGGCVDTGRVIRRQCSSSTAGTSETEIAGPGRERELARLAKLWVSGAAVDWMALYPHKQPRRISLPTYPFQPQRYWLGSQGELSREERRRPPGRILKLQDENKGDSGMKVTTPVAKPRRFAKYGAASGPETTGEPGPVTAASGEVTRSSGNEAALREKIREMLAAVLYLKPGEIDENKPFIDLGLDSILGVELINHFNKTCHTAIKATKLYDYATVAEFAKYAAGIVPPATAGSGDHSPVPPQLEKRTIRLSIAGAGRAEARPPSAEKIAIAAKTTGNGDIAIIGMAARYPGAEDPWKLWRMLENGDAAVREVPPERWDIQRYYDPDKTAAGKSYCKYGGFLEEIDRFDPLFFNIAPADAVQIEPQQRLFLQEAWRALENAGYSLEALNNLKCGVYVGVGSINEYNPGYMFNTSSILAARIAYFLNLKGPAVSLDTACSSSLAAIHMACRCLRDGEAEMMLAGGVTVYLTEKLYIQMCRSEMLSPDGKCKSFAAGANGFVPAEGVGVVVLKCLDRALRDGDYIYGVIKGSGMNQDGRTNGITAPSAQSQRELEIAVYDQNGIDPETISYVEAHGTGTQLGDPIEFEALTDAFRNYTAKKQFCGLGSIKTNLGHTAAAAGVAGVIKILLALKYGKIPPTLNFKEPNRHIDLEESPFYISTELRDWRGDSLQPRRAAVSAFGFSGTNVHMVLEEAPPVFAGERRAVKPYYLVPLSAKTAASLVRRVADLRDWLEREAPEHSLADISYTLLTGRSHFGVRLAFVVASRKELRERLAKVTTGGIPETAFAGTGKEILANKAVCFELGKMLFGQLQTYPGLGDELYREKLTALAELFGSGYDLEWRDLFSAGEARRIPLPMYPFTPKRYWMTRAEAPEKEQPQPEKSGLSRPAVELKPLLRPNREQTVQILTALFSRSFCDVPGETGPALPAGISLQPLSEKNRNAGRDLPYDLRPAVRLKTAQSVHPGSSGASSLERPKTDSIYREEGAGRWQPTKLRRS